MLRMGVHLSQYCADPVVLHAQLLNPLLIVGADLVDEADHEFIRVRLGPWHLLLLI